MPQWMPQNIQKRLLLYVLQQLALFSEIELPNLEEVSLNNIALRDVKIDPERVGPLPGCTLRSGRVGLLELNGGVMGGVQVDLSDVEAVVDVDALRGAPRPPEGAVHFLLAKSTADLASTMEGVEGAEGAEAGPGGAETGSSSAETGSSDGQPRPRSAALGGMVARAAEMALLRLQVRAVRVGIRVVAELTDIRVEVSEVAVKTVNGKREVTVRGLRVVTLRPEVAAGRLDPPAASASSASSESSAATLEDEDGYGEESLMDSMMFTHEEASSIYMSATSQAFGAGANAGAAVEAAAAPAAASAAAPAVVLHLDSAAFTFTTDFAGLEARLGQVHLACVPLVPTAISILSGITRSLKMAHYQRKRDNFARTRSLRFPQYDADDNPALPPQVPTLPAEPLFHRLHIHRIVVGLTTALGRDGAFAADAAAVRVVLSNVNVKQKSDELLYGGVERLGVVQAAPGGWRDVAAFVDEAAAAPTAAAAAVKADLRFELFRGATPEFTALCLKPLEVRLDAAALAVLAAFARSLSLTWSHYAAARAHIGARERLGAHGAASSPAVIFQSALIDVQVALSPGFALKTIVLPLLFRLALNHLSVPKVVVSCLALGVEHTLSVITDIKLHTALKEFKAFVRGAATAGAALAPREVSLNSELVLTVPAVAVSADWRLLRRIVGEVGRFLAAGAAPSPALNLPPHSQRGRAARGAGRAGSGSIGPGRAVSFRLEVHTVDVEAVNVSALFGNFCARFERVALDLLRNGDLQGSVGSLKWQREQGNTIEPFLHLLGGHRGPTPLVVFTYRASALHAAVWNVVVEYYTEWLRVLAPDAGTEAAGAGAVALAAAAAATPSAALEVKIEFYECAIGLTPGRLPCKAFVAVQRGTTQLTRGDPGDQLLVKSSLRQLEVFLVDDAARVAWPRRGPLRASEWLAAAGVLNVGHLNATHVGFTVNSDIEALHRRNRRLGINERLSLLEVKVNVDDLALAACADLAHTLAQIASDLKLPIVFSDRQKYKVEVEEPVDVWLAASALFEDTPREDDAASLSIVDEYMGAAASVGELEQEMSALSVSAPAASFAIEDEHFVAATATAAAAVPVLIYLNVSRVHVRLHDGYDWPETRSVIEGAVQRVESGAAAEAAAAEEEEEGEEEDRALIGETLYQSIHLLLPAGASPARLTRNINKSVHSAASEAGGVELTRSPHHKVAVEVQTVEVVVAVHTTRDPRTPPATPPAEPGGAEVVNAVSVLAENFEVLDNVPTLTWHKVVTYLRSAGERELQTRAVRVSVTELRPDRALCATEAIVDVAVLPLRLHVDQDTLDFLVRFAEFRDARFRLPIDDILYMEKFSLAALRIKLDYKPKKIDYAGIRLGHAAEFINFFVLDGAEVLLRSVRLYGVHGFPQLARRLQSVWAPDVQATQLSGVLAGLAPLRSIVNIGTGVRDLVAIPMKEYRKDGRIVRSLQRGAFLFAKTTSTELLKLGVKITAGTQVLLEQGEEAFGGEGGSARRPGAAHGAATEGAGDLSGSDCGSDHDDVDMPLVYALADRKAVEADLMASSQILNQSVQVDERLRSSLTNRKLYLFAEIDDSQAIEQHLRHAAHRQRAKRGAPRPRPPRHTEEQQKAVSLYSNQPLDAQEGLRLAYTSIGKNLGDARAAAARTRDAMSDAETVSEAAYAMARGAPLVLIRPIIGATEAVLKTLLGFTNQIDPDQKLESEEKYKPIRK
jgi:autophagy-related protein 2